VPLTESGGIDVRLVTKIFIFPSMTHAKTEREAMNVRKYPYNPDYAVAPGETVRETMECLGLTQREFAMRLGTSVQTLNRIFRGTQRITEEMANKLERVTGTPASFWNNFESRYRLQLSKVSYPRP
jgi:addiction module HigA family antidote